MILDRKKGSHFIYKLGEPFFILSIQKTKDGKAKAYQVRQLLNFIEENDLDQKD
jgi:translation elongation factor P/translation initiation factor 5A